MCVLMFFVVFVFGFCCMGVVDFLSIIVLLNFG